jgi:hypothetical protein
MAFVVFVGVQMATVNAVLSCLLADPESLSRFSELNWLFRAHRVVAGPDVVSQIQQCLDLKCAIPRVFQARFQEARLTVASDAPYQ